MLFGLGEGGRERDDPGTALVVAATHPPAKTPPRQTRRRMTLTLAVLALAGVLATRALIGRGRTARPSRVPSTESGARTESVVR